MSAGSCCRALDIDMERKKTRQIDVGGIKIGGGAAISIQSMTNTFTEDIKATTEQIRRLSDAGCDICRLAVPSEKAATAFGEIKRSLRADGINVPLVADIHFDYKLAIASINAGADKIRINPGNIGDTERIKAVVDAAGMVGLPIRIGVNSGSLEKDILESFGGSSAEALAKSALRNAAIIEKMGFSDLVVSIKSSNVEETLKAHRLFSENSDLPLHIGITEAGVGLSAVIKSSVGIGALLSEGIGDTMRVSLTGDPVTEIPVARGILRSLGLLPGAIELISCPTCGRTKSDLKKIASDVAKALDSIEIEQINREKNKLRVGNTAQVSVDEKHITVAVMGCAVNGPGEAAQADLGVACGENNAVYFEKGEKIKTVASGEIVSVLLEGVKKLLL